MTDFNAIIEAWRLFWTAIITATADFTGLSFDFIGWVVVLVVFPAFGLVLRAMLDGLIDWIRYHD